MSSDEARHRRAALPTIPAGSGEWPPANATPAPVQPPVPVAIAASPPLASEAPVQPAPVKRLHAGGAQHTYYNTSDRADRNKSAAEAQARVDQERKDAEELDRDQTRQALIIGIPAITLLLVCVLAFILFVVPHLSSR